MTDNLKHDPWTNLTHLATTRIETAVKAGNLKVIDKLLADLCNSTMENREVLTTFLIQSLHQEND